MSNQEKTYHSDSSLPTEQRENALLEKSWANLMLTISEQQDKARKRRVVKYSMLSAIFLMSIGVSLFYLRPNVERRQLATTKATMEKSHICKLVANESAKKIDLIDGSTITLWPHSVLSYNAINYNKVTRTLLLEVGKAEFEVAKNKHCPFIVKSTSFTTTALGTIFSVDRRSNSKIEMFLKRGKIKIEGFWSSGKEMPMKVLHPGEKFILNVSQETAQLKTSSPSNQALAMAPKQMTNAIKETARNLGTHFTIIKDSIYFNACPLDEVFQVLQKKAGIHIHQTFSNSKSRQWFTGNIAASDNVESIISLICSMQDLHYIKKNQEFIIQD